MCFHLSASGLALENKITNSTERTNRNGFWKKVEIVSESRKNASVLDFQIFISKEIL